MNISIHALREEGDIHGVSVMLWDSLFLSTPSARRATFRKSTQVQIDDISIHALREEGDTPEGFMEDLAAVFLSTPSARRATQIRHCSRVLYRISIHALREEGDWPLSHLPDLAGNISIHALREEGDGSPQAGDHGRKKFLSTPSARRATPGPWYRGRWTSDFYPRPPRGGRHNRNGPFQKG